MNEIKFTVYCTVIYKGRLLLLHRKDPDVWESPRGKIEFGEHLRNAAIRELLEETGIKIKE